MTTVQTFAGGAFGQNTYVAHDPETSRAVVIDPGAMTSEALGFVEQSGLEIEAVLLTHAHLDHIEGLATVRNVTPAPIWLHPGDRPLYDTVLQQAAMFGVRMSPPPDPDEELAHGQVLEMAGARWEVRHAPGHAPGHVVFWSEADGVCLAGDVIFAGSIGRTDLPGGDYRMLMASIRREILSLPDEARLLTGHGPETTVGFERRTNPFLVPQFGGELV